MHETEEINGWCLRENKEVKITYPKDIMGALFTCPYCGLIEETRKNLAHVFEPSGPLLETLKTQSELDSLYEELSNIFWEVFREYEDSISRDFEDNNFQRFYFQGKKDGIRTALAMLTPIASEGTTFWEDQQYSSGKGWATKREKYEHLLNDIYYLVNERILPSIEYPHPWYVSLSNWESFVEQSGLLEEENE